VYVASRAIAQGRLAGVCSAVGVCLGILVHTALAAFGLGALLLASEGLFLAVKIVGAIYLVVLGVRMLLSKSADIPSVAASRVSLATLVWQGLLSNVTNPKMVVFFVAFLPQFADPASPHPTRDLAVLGALYAAMALPIKGAVGIAAGSLSQRVLQRPGVLAWANRACGAVLVGLGLRLVASPR
jgi:threonine/homoserine/homoserine lactone efflux protein